MRRNIVALLALIVCNILLVLGTLYVTRNAFYDFENVSYSQRSHYKTYTITQMAAHYYGSKEFQSQSDASLGEFLSRTITDPNEGCFLFKWEPENGFPIICIEGNKIFQKYYAAGTFKAGIILAETSGIIARSELLPIYNKISTYQLTVDNEPSIITQFNGYKYLVTWTIIPAPNPFTAKYLYVVFTPTSTITGMLTSLRWKYIWLFSGATMLAGVVLVIIPIVVRRCINND
jgi:hypothetical protein